MSFISLARMLAYAGTLPFIGAALDAWSILPLTQWLGIKFAGWGVAYGVIILSFISGMQWVYAMTVHNQSADTHRSLRLLLNANFVALWAWLMWGLSPHGFATLGLALAFLWMLWWDATNRTPCKEQDWSWQVRWQATFVAVTCLLLIAVKQGVE